jgi:hypothetical protein
MEVEMFQPIDNDEEITDRKGQLEIRKGNTLRERIQINLVFTKLLILPLVTFLLLV